MVGFQDRAIRRNGHWHVREAADDFRKQAFLGGSEMGVDDEGRAKIWGHCPEQMLQRVNTAGGRTYPDDWKRS